MFVCTLLILCFQGAKSNHSITIDDYFSLSYVSSCAVSPNGVYTAWTEGRWDETLDKRNTDIWIIKTNDPNAIPLRLTFDESYDGSLQWGIDESW